MSAPKIAAVRGMNDMLPAQAPLWEAFEAQTAQIARGLRLPADSHTGAGVDRPVSTGSGRSDRHRRKGNVQLRRFAEQRGPHAETPKTPAGVVRAVIEHNLLYEGPCRLWYFGPMFRHERPAARALSQFYQAGAEALGLAGPDVDAEQILMLARLWQQLGLTGISAGTEFSGQPPERARHPAAT